MANVERIKYCIELMKNAKNLQMRNWQGSLDGRLIVAHEDVVQSVERLHECGTAACFAGYVAISEKFKEDGGRPGFGGGPSIGFLFGSDAIADWLEISIAEARLLIFGVDDRNYQSTYFYGKPLTEVTAADVIEKLEALLQ